MTGAPRPAVPTGAGPRPRGGGHHPAARLLPGGSGRVAGGRAWPQGPEGPCFSPGTTRRGHGQAQLACHLRQDPPPAPADQQGGISRQLQVASTLLDTQARRRARRCQLSLPLRLRPRCYPRIKGSLSETPRAGSILWLPPVVEDSLPHCQLFLCLVENPTAAPMSPTKGGLWTSASAPLLGPTQRVHQPVQCKARALPPPPLLSPEPPTQPQPSLSDPPKGSGQVRGGCPPPHPSWPRSGTESPLASAHTCRDPQAPCSPWRVQGPSSGPSVPLSRAPQGGSASPTALLPENGRAISCSCHNQVPQTG